MENSLIYSLKKCDSITVNLKIFAAILVTYGYYFAPYAFQLVS